MRITSGKARGISLASPRGDATRPATDAARQAVFSSLGEVVAEAVVADLFAGTGSYALEALSRGAKTAVFFENGREALACLKKNATAIKTSIEKCGDSATCEIFPTDVFKSGKILASKKPNIVFADPPYAMLGDIKILKKLFETFAEAASDDTRFILEAPADFEIPADILPPEYKAEIIKRLGKTSRGKPSQIVFRIRKS